MRWQLTREQAAAEFLLDSLIPALDRFGVGQHVGLLNPAVFPRHKGGIGIVVGCDLSVRLAVAELLEQMGCQWTAEDDTGVEAHLASKRDLHQEFGLAPLTIRKAVRLLRDEGLVTVVVGRGVYVVKKDQG
jgi:hypothetical protein